MSTPYLSNVSPSIGCFDAKIAMADVGGFSAWRLKPVSCRAKLQNVGYLVLQWQSFLRPMKGWNPRKKGPVKNTKKLLTTGLQVGSESTMISYRKQTENIEVKVQPIWLDGQSSSIEKRFVFGYYITIVNNSFREVQLLRRHWFIRDDNGKVQEVEGEGVIGQQPIIEPGGMHSYNSYCIIETFSGSMEGTYLMEWENGERFKAEIPEFILRAAVN